MSLFLNLTEKFVMYHEHVKIFNFNLEFKNYRFPHNILARSSIIKRSLLLAKVMKKYN